MFCLHFMASYENMHKKYPFHESYQQKPWNCVCPCVTYNKTYFCIANTDTLTYNTNKFESTNGRCIPILHFPIVRF